MIHVKDDEGVIVSNQIINFLFQRVGVNFQVQVESSDPRIIQLIILQIENVFTKFLLLLVKLFSSNSGGIDIMRIN